LASLNCLLSLKTPAMTEAFIAQWKNNATTERAGQP
jgi:hypothetical protein